MSWGKPSHWRERRAARFAAVEPAPAQQASLHLDIERLTLSGVQRRDAPAVARAVQAEIVRLAAQTASAPPDASRIKAGKIALGPTPATWGSVNTVNGIWRSERRRMLLPARRS